MSISERSSNTGGMGCEITARSFRLLFSVCEVLCVVGDGGFCGIFHRDYVERVTDDGGVFEPVKAHSVIFAPLVEPQLVDFPRAPVKDEDLRIMVSSVVEFFDRGESIGVDRNVVN